MPTYAERMERRRLAQLEAEQRKKEEALVASAQETEVGKTFAGFMQNFASDAIDVGKGMVYPITHWDEFKDGMVDLVTDENGDFHTGELLEAGGQVVDRYKEIASDPSQSLYDRPLSTAMDIASLAFPVRGAAKMLPDGSTAQKVVDGAANVVQNMDPVSMATTSVAALNAAVTNPIKTTESVVKPSNAKTSKQRDPGHRERVMTGALERGIAPNERGMGTLQRQLDKQFEQIDKVIMNSNVTIPMKDITDGWESWAKAQISQTDANWSDLRNAVDAQGAKIKAQYSTTPDGDKIVGVSPEGLREMRISADGQVNHNKVNMVDDSVTVQVEKLYANYLREKLGDWIPEIKPINAEASILFDIEDMYLPSVNRNNNNNPMGLTSSMGTMATGMLVNNNAEQLLPQAVGAAMVLAPPLINGVGPRINRAGSSFRSRQAGGGNNPVSGAVGALARDRNNIPFYLRQGGSFIEAMNQELMRQEEEER